VTLYCLPASSNGHYTAFGKNPETGLWNCFNDSSVNPKVPSEEEFSSAYVLFYARKGMIVKGFHKLRTGNCFTALYSSVSSSYRSFRFEM
jgi:hypothetical protein